MYEHLVTLQKDESLAASLYVNPHDGKPTVWLKVGPSVIEIKDPAEVIDILQAIQTEIPSTQE